MKLEVGKSYLDRSGNVVTIVEISTELDFDLWPHRGDNGLSYADDGIYGLEPGERDLVKEVTGLSIVPPDCIDMDVTDAVLDEVFTEREAQQAKWGEQNHTPEGWLPILSEEFGEVARGMNEADWPNYREELIQVAAVAVAMVESFDRNRAAIVNAFKKKGA